MQKARRVLVAGQADDEEQKQKAAEWALQLASPELIVEMVKEMQGLKGRFYSEVAERLYGQDLEPEQMAHVERSICEMLHRRKITVAGLAEWYRLAIETLFDGDRFTPLPDYADCVKLAELAQDSTRRLREAAQEIVEPAVLPHEIRRLASLTTVKTLPELFEELKKKFE
ncbi:hypothetical protein [Prosthecochloris sp.]|uniref:hypothetical protein n=1 Tax=Prosthecochloris sp. TaxID=290513 RepID=UPI0025D5F464|nr:hypothetical protein [Prosthecochloris sp.]